jgi:hypothetical protein
MLKPQRRRCGGTSKTLKRSYLTGFDQRGIFAVGDWQSCGKEIASHGMAAYIRVESPTNCARTCQCREWGRRLPVLMSAARGVRRPDCVCRWRISELNIMCDHLTREYCPGVKRAGGRTKPRNHSCDFIDGSQTLKSACSDHR